MHRCSHSWQRHPQLSAAAANTERADAPHERCVSGATGHLASGNRKDIFCLSPKVVPPLLHFPSAVTLRPNSWATFFFFLFWPFGTQTLHIFKALLPCHPWFFFHAPSSVLPWPLCLQEVSSVSAGESWIGGRVHFAKEPITVLLQRAPTFTVGLGVPFIPLHLLVKAIASSDVQTQTKPTKI